MKKYPLSTKAFQAMLATTIAVAPIVTTGGLFGENKVEAATTSSDAIKRVELIYSKFNSSEKAIFNDAATGLDSFTEKDWTDVLSKDVADRINSELNSSVTAEAIIAEFATLIYGSNSSNLQSQLAALKSSDEGKAFETLLGSGSIDLILQFLVDAEKEIWKLNVSDLFKALKDGSIQDITVQVRNNLINNSKEYSKLNTNINQKLGINLEGLFDIKDRVNDKLVSKKVISTPELTTLRNAFLNAAFSAGNPNPGNGGGGGGGGGVTPPVTPPTPEKPSKIELPAGSTEKVTENGAVITKISADKVQGIVDLITSEKSVVPLKLEKATAGEEVKASVPAALFTELAKKNKKAIVEVLTDEASYKLPATEINVAELAKKLGVNESDVQIIVSVNVVDTKAVADTVGKNKLKPVSKVIEFTVEAVSGDKKESVAKFSTYVERDIVSENNFNAGRSVAVKLNEDGTFSSVPTLFDGKTATIKSLTNSKYTIVENDKTFPDVDKKHWAEKYIDTLASKYIIAGNDNGKYAPQEDMTRAQFTVLLVRALGLPAAKYDNHFKDVKGNEWFNAKDEVMAAVNYGIIYGKENGRFAPNDKITRAEAATMIHRAMNLDFINFDATQLDKKKKIGDFKDASKVGAWAKESVEAVYQAGIFGGKDNGTFDPNGNTKRDQMAKILAEFLVSAKLMNDIK